MVSENDPFSGVCLFRNGDKLRVAAYCRATFEVTNSFENVSPKWKELTISPEITDDCGDNNGEKRTLEKTKGSTRFSSSMWTFVLM